MKATVVIVDDEPRMVDVLSMVLRRAGHEVQGFTNPERFLEALGEGEPCDVLLVDLKMPQLDGLEVLRRAVALEPTLPVILMTAFATVQTALSAMRDGAFDYLQKPFDNQLVRAAVRRALDHTRLERENRHLRAQLRTRYALDNIVARSPAMIKVLERVRRVARTPSTVLIQGESGTGKELIARALHVHSDRVAKPFIAVNAGAFAPGVLESELFGHEKGAFTGASGARAGLFERADGGTLFLDEIGEIAPTFQTRLLRVLQEREVLRVGGDKPRGVDVRLITATNRDLRQMSSQGSFREDLYFRLAVIPLKLPPLRERPEAIMPLAQRFLALHNHRMGRRVRGFSPQVEAFLQAYRWPGNVRELENTIERGVVLTTTDTIEEEHLLMDDAQVSEGKAAGDVVISGTLQETVERATVACVRRALEAAGGRRAEAAGALGIERTTLYRLMRKHGIE